MVSIIIFLLMIVPIIIGVLGAFFPSFGYFPLLGGDGFNFDSYRQFFALPGIGNAIGLSLCTGIMATLISTLVAVILPGILYGQKGFEWIRHYLAPILSLPHVAVAVGLVFLLQPSGWLMRLISPSLTGLDRPPIWAIVPDHHGLALITGLVAKEVPFLLLMTVAALSQINTRPLLTTGRSLGYGALASWVYLIIPQLWPRLRLPIMIVMVFSVSVVDMAVVLSPSTASPLAVRLLTLYQDPELNTRFVASAAAMMQIFIAGLAMVLWFLGEKIAAAVMRHFAAAGNRLALPPPLMSWVMRPLIIMAALVPSMLAVFGLVAAVLWSVAGRWRFPAAFPDSLTMKHWFGLSGSLGDIVLTTVILGFVTALIAVALVMFWLSHLDNRASSFRERLIFLPLLLPQAAFLFGIQVVLLLLHIDGTWIALIWAHLLFVLPYVWLSLAPAWRGFDRRWLWLAASLGAHPFRRFFAVRLPILCLPILTSLAIGFSVSAALYLPTVFASNGRIVTLTVEAVTLASGASRHQLGVATALQMLLPLVVFTGAMAVSHYRYRRFSYFS